MPMYTYRCKQCEQTVDILRRHDEQSPPDNTECEPCTAKPKGRAKTARHEWEKIIHAPNVAFGGSWSPTGGSGKGSW